MSIKYSKEHEWINAADTNAAIVGITVHAQDALGDVVFVDLPAVGSSFKAGDVAGYAFSEPMKASGLTWDEKTLDTYLTNPMKMVPGTRMTFAGMPDAAKRKEVIDYIKTLK